MREYNYRYKFLRINLAFIFVPIKEKFYNRQQFPKNLRITANNSFHLLFFLSLSLILPNDVSATCPWYAYTSAVKNRHCDSHRNRDAQHFCSNSNIFTFKGIYKRKGYKGIFRKYEELYKKNTKT